MSRGWKSTPEEPCYIPVERGCMGEERVYVNAMILWQLYCNGTPTLLGTQFPKNAQKVLISFPKFLTSMYFIPHSAKNIYKYYELFDIEIDNIDKLFF